MRTTKELIAFWDRVFESPPGDNQTVREIWRDYAARQRELLVSVSSVKPIDDPALAEFCKRWKDYRPQPKTFASAPAQNAKE